MPTAPFSKSTFYRRPPAATIILVFMLGALVVAGGASRTDALGQAVVRLAAFASLAFAALFLPRLDVRELRSSAFLMACIIALPLLQLIPLPPSIWHLLPGASFGKVADDLLHEGQHWRPVTLVPSATLSALYSLAVPVAVWVLGASLKPSSRGWLPSAVMAIAGVAMLVALVQAAGNRFDQPLIGYKNQVSGVFANRNHFALMMALGCLVAPMWALTGERDSWKWRGPVAIGLILLFVLGTLASGSRAGMAAIAAAFVIGPILVRHDIARVMKRSPRWVIWLSAILLSVTLGAAIVASVSTDRAVSITRLLDQDIGSDMRARALPTVLIMLKAYFPVGIGFGGFDAAFRTIEPFTLLKPTYFNQAHDDILGVVIDGGAPALLILLVAITWWIRMTWKVWRCPQLLEPVIWGRAGSMVIALTFFASIVDYPARVPIIMAMLTIAGLWLTWGGSAASDASSLPGTSSRI